MTLIPSALDLDLRATAKAYGSGWHKVSYSKMSQFRRCQVSWFIENYAVPLEREIYSEDSVSAIPGTITQRVWEALVNDRIFARFATMGELVQWCRQQTAALFHLIVFPMDAQFDMPRDVLRKFFKTEVGKQRIEWAQREHGLDPTFKNGIQPKFTDLAKFADKHKSIEQFLAKLSDQYEPTLNKLAELGVDLNRMLAEQFIRAKFGQYELAGGVDFLYNKLPMNGPFKELRHLQNDYILLDGKAQIGPTVSASQLFFYATILYMMYRKLPSFVGFLDWSKSDFVWYPFKLEQVEQTKRSVSAMQLTAHKLNESLQRQVAQTPPDQNTLSTYNVPHLEFTPSRMGCLFCGLSNVCESAKNAGYSRQKPADYIPHKKQVPEGLDVSQLAGTPTDVSFE